MKTFRSIGFFFIVAFVFVLGPHRLSAEVFNRVVAIVNDDVITLYELNQKIREVTGSAAEVLRDKDEGMYLETRRKILELMINEKCAEEKIRELALKSLPSKSTRPLKP